MHPERSTEDLAARVEELEERLELLAASVRYDPSEPYLAALVRHDVVAERMSEVNLVIHAILSRALGEPVAAHRPPRDIVASPALDAAFVDEPIDRAEAVALLGRIVGSDQAGAEILDAHRDRGLGREGHRALGRADGGRGGGTDSVRAWLSRLPALAKTSRRSRRTSRGRRPGRDRD